MTTLSFIATTKNKAAHLPQREERTFADNVEWMIHDTIVITYDYETRDNMRYLVRKIRSARNAEIVYGSILTLHTEEHLAALTEEMLQSQPIPIMLQHNPNDDMPIVTGGVDNSAFTDDLGDTTQRDIERMAIYEELADLAIDEVNNDIALGLYCLK